jgi:hypothetical protein
MGRGEQFNWGLGVRGLGFGAWNLVFGTLNSVVQNKSGSRKEPFLLHFNFVEVLI